MQQPIACPQCGAGLPLPDAYGRAWCGYCCVVHESASAERIVEAAARIAMVDPEVLALLRQHFSATDSMYLAPNLPLRTEENARKVHGARLPVDEVILGLYDDTLFDSGEDGFVVTAKRLCWKNEGESPRSMEWADLDPDRLFADGKRLFVGAGMLVLTDEAVVDAAADVFHILALSARAHSVRTPRGTQLMPAAPRHPSSRPTYRPPREPTLESRAVPFGVSAERLQSAPPPPVTVHPTPQPQAYSYVQYAVQASSQPAPAFECWHCHTAIDERASRCDRCSAWPTPAGWMRAG
ncbi:MAG: hypothetical protein JST00_09270 [Deltaproteobacteria bacterium]|nr:hypothetical protein [Deltaproteobacteria bacterium]